MTIGDVESVGRRIVEAVGEAVVGKREEVTLILAALLADGHVLIEDLPGVGKTLLVKSLGAATGLEHNRIQFTPDLMPMDITGSTVLDPVGREPTFRPDRKSTRLNSSHVKISYVVFCLKKKT